MALDVNACTRLVAWTAFVLFEIYQMSNSKRRQYDAEVGGIRMPVYQLPSWIFSWVWFTLKALIVTSMFFWCEYAINTNDWTYPTVFALVFALVLFSKFWTVLFFEYSMYGAALLLSMFLSALSITAMVIMVISSNEGTLWALPFALFVPVTAWYFFAMLLNFEWYRLKSGWYTRSCDDEEGIYYVVTTTNERKAAVPHHHSHHGHGQHKFQHPHAAHHQFTGTGKSKEEDEF